MEGLEIELLAHPHLLYSVVVSHQRRTGGKEAVGLLVLRGTEDEVSVSPSCCWETCMSSRIWAYLALAR